MTGMDNRKCDVVMKVFAKNLGPIRPGLLALSLVLQSSPVLVDASQTGGWSARFGDFQKVADIRSR